MSEMTNHPRSILVVESLPFGRALAALPAIKALRFAYPKTLIAAAATRGIIELLTLGNFIDEAIDLGVIHSSNQGLLSAAGRSARLFGSTRKENFEMVLDFSPGPETQVISRIILGAKTITPISVSNFVDRLLGRSRTPRAGDHRAECASVLDQLGISVDDREPPIQPSAEDNDKFEQLLARNKSRGGEPIALLHGAIGDERRGWSAQKFGELALMLNNFGARIVAVDEPHRRAFTGDMSSVLPKGSIKLAAPRAIELLAAIARASIFITDEPGIADAASDFGTPVLEVAEASSITTRDESSRSKNHRVIDGASRTRITAEEVYELAAEMIQENRSSLLFR
jgi:ADP-heptose:LPS heptosyltransferase